MVKLKSTLEKQRRCLQDICSLIGTKAEKKFPERKVAGNADLQ